MNLEIRARDVTALFDRLGLSSSTYREFPSQKTAATPLNVESLTPAPKAAGTSGSLVAAPSPFLEKLPKPNSSPEMRWNVLHSISKTSAESRKTSRSSVTKVAFFSLSGGVGKTTLAASLARVLGSRSLHVVLVNRSHEYAMEQYLPAKAPRFGGIGFMHAPVGGKGAPVTVINASSLNAWEGGEGSQTAFLTAQATRNADILLVDLPVTLDLSSREVLIGSDHIVIPLIPDLQSVASIEPLEAMLTFHQRPAPEVHYILNRYDESRLFHREVRARLQKLVGSRLHAVAVREDRLVQEATGGGLTIADYAPEAGVNGDLQSLADWLEVFSARITKFCVESKPGAIA